MPKGIKNETLIYLLTQVSRRGKNQQDAYEFNMHTDKVDTFSRIHILSIFKKLHLPFMHSKKSSISLPE